MKPKMATKMFIYVKKYYKGFILLAVCITLYAVFVFAKEKYTNADFGKTFGKKAIEAESKIKLMQESFQLCATLCNEKPLFMQSIVFPEVMRYSSLKDGIETESLRTLYVQFGEEYANFSIGIFQMKPTFAAQVEAKAVKFLPDRIYKELQLAYKNIDKENIRNERVGRLQDENWQMIYLTAFVLICNEQYKNKIFLSVVDRLQYYATVYNAGFEKTDEYISKKIMEANFYAENGMPDKKFKYAAIATYFFNKVNK
jgi:hypothetical protein